MRVLIIVSILLASPSWALAQAQVLAARPFQAAADHDGANTDGYRLYVDGTKSGADLPKGSVLLNGVVTVTVPALAVGTHIVELSGYRNASGILPASEGPKSTGLSVAAIAEPPPPARPGNLRLLSMTVNVAADGTVTVTDVQVRAQTVANP